MTGPNRFDFVGRLSWQLKNNNWQITKRLRFSCINKSQQSRLLDRWEQKSRLDNPAIAGRKPKLLNAKNTMVVHLR